MNKTTVTFFMLALAAVFVLVTPMDVAVAQTNNTMSEGDEERNDGEHKEGKSCLTKSGK